MFFFNRFRLSPGSVSTKDSKNAEEVSTFTKDNSIYIECSGGNHSSMCGLFDHRLDVKRTVKKRIPFVSFPLSFHRLVGYIQQKHTNCGPSDINNGCCCRTHSTLYALFCPPFYPKLCVNNIYTFDLGCERDPPTIRCLHCQHETETERLWIQFNWPFTKKKRFNNNR